MIYNFNITNVREIGFPLKSATKILGSISSIVYLIFLVASFREIPVIWGDLV